MPNYYIKKITVTGNNVKDSSIEFEKGLNIIYGPSNTGKSYIAECINYMFGSKTKSFRINSDIGYDCVHMLIKTLNGEVHLKRYFESNDIYVKSSNPNIQSGKYSTTSGKTHINSLWLNLMGIDNPPKIIKNENFKRQNLTLRTFLHTFFIEEENIIQNESIIFNKSGFSKTAILSILLYFITGNALEDFDINEEKAVKEAKKIAVRNYINGNLSNLANWKNELSRSDIPSVEVIQGKIDFIINEIGSTEGTLSDALKRSKKLSSEIYELNEQIAECNMLYSRYQVLRGQYISDINRLTFIVEGELHMNETPEVFRCPFCDGSLKKQKRESCADAAGVELVKIQYQLNDLKDAEEDIVSEMNELNIKSDILKKERIDIEEVINSELKPKLESLRQALSQYQKSIEIHKETSIIRHLETNMIIDLVKFEAEEESEIKYRPKEYFNSEIIQSINTILDNILDTSNFDNYSSSYFSKETFDVVINGNHKAKYGKGYRAFLNTVVALTFLKYLTYHGAYSPGILIIDSPILSLKEKGSEQASYSMKNSLFQYFLDNQDIGQIIIIENETPDLDYSNANLIHFTKDVNVGRYGFLYGITE